MDITQSQDPSMDDDGLWSEVLVLDIADVDHGLQREVIASCGNTQTLKDPD